MTKKPKDKVYWQALGSRHWARWARRHRSEELFEIVEHEPQENGAYATGTFGLPQSVHKATQAYSKRYGDEFDLYAYLDGWLRSYLDLEDANAKSSGLAELARTVQHKSGLRVEIVEDKHFSC